MKILYLIPARSGSKGIIHKNIKLFKGKPLITWSIKQAISSSHTQSKLGHECRTIVSTDSREYALIANKYNAETPFIRPPEISTDTSTDYEFMIHAIHNLRLEDWVPDMIVHLRPTQPIRSVSLIDTTIETFIKNYDKYSSLRTVSILNKSPFKSYTIQNNILKPLFPSYNTITEPYNVGRQMLPQCFLHNGYIDITKSSTLIRDKSVTGNKIYPYVIDKEDFIDIDTQDDFLKAQSKDFIQ